MNINYEKGETTIVFPAEEVGFAKDAVEFIISLYSAERKVDTSSVEKVLALMKAEAGDLAPTRILH